MGGDQARQPLAVGRTDLTAPPKDAMAVPGQPPRNAIGRADRWG